MRLTACLASLCGGFLLSQLACAAEPLPQRWVSAGGSLSEWIVELGGEAKLVGVDTTSQHPARLKALPSLGYQRQLAAEGILSLKPDLLLGSEEVGPPPVLEQVKRAGVRIEALSTQADLPTLEHSLTRIGALLGAQQRAAQVLAAYRQRLQTQARWVAAAQRSQPAPRVLLLLGHAGSSPLAAGRDTAAAWLIEQAGGRNVTTHAGYKALSTEALLALDPEVLIFADRGLAGAAAKQALLKHNPALAATRAARAGRLLELDPTLLVGGLGPRIPAGLAVLSAAFYPAAQALTAEAKPQP
ncbi:hemin ABC transporter substrate-binding protein [Pseudomonas sp. 2FG]|uniref:heme/hemin ABC transporter substrate-binding protein n=1 Tax=Pseudomonas sp. 2FG TaxID=2502191 RepID=UPI0010F43F78|nr:ABC transporter substrate-binding protein [Pseudomonas sp. 2FG]